MNTYQSILKQLLEAGIDKDSAMQAALLITSGFVEPTQANLRNGWTSQLANDFIKLYKDFGATYALNELDKAVIK